MNAKDILTKVINQTGLSPSEFQNSLNLSPRSTRVNDVLTGRVVKISASFADVIRDTYPIFNKKFLIAGIGPMLNVEDEILPNEGLSPRIIINTLMYVYGFANPKKFAEAINVDKSWAYLVCKEGKRPLRISKIKSAAIRLYIDEGLSDIWLRTGKGSVYTDGRPDPLYAIEAAKNDSMINDIDSPLQVDGFEHMQTNNDITKLVAAFTEALEKVESKNEARYEEIMGLLRDKGYNIHHTGIDYAAEDVSNE